MTEIREEMIDLIKANLIGPNPKEGFTQDNGQEILFFESPLQTYVAGILFPQILEPEFIQDEEILNDEDSDNSNSIKIDEHKKTESTSSNTKFYPEPIIEAETSKINSYKQSALGITVCVPKSISVLTIKASAGEYIKEKRKYPVEKEPIDGKPNIDWSEKEQDCYLRKQVNAVCKIDGNKLPTKDNIYNTFSLLNEENNVVIEFYNIAVTYRLEDENFIIFTITLVNNHKKEKQDGNTKFNAEECWFQVGFSVNCPEGFVPLPDNFCNTVNDEDYKLNSLLYSDVKTYGIGHGCAATWDDSLKTAPKIVNASILPEYDVKPIVPTSISKCSFSMELYSKNKTETINDLSELCNSYENWIEIENQKINSLEEHFKNTARKQIEECKKCLNRMRHGVDLLKTDDTVLTAFQLANKAMLMQQLHYRLPLTKYSGYDSEKFSLKLENSIVMPDLDDKGTWHNNKTEDNPNGFTYGKWRPFQIAFILMNLESLNNKESSERKFVDLIWFPTGGGKTEAYLGLTAYTIFLRRLKNPNDSGTTVIMRYTLRLLTSQQYERASSLICSMEKIRSENVKLLGNERITIGLWVGQSLTENNSDDVRRKINNIKSGKESGNVSVILKCPWCGASMETFKINKMSESFRKTARRGRGNTNSDSARTPGYKISDDNKHILFQCENPSCDFSDEHFTLPLSLFDDEIYLNPPTLLFGTVDKFAMLPYYPKAKSLFGGDRKHTPPELIIQDELHLITGPLGSCVGLYEILINQLCVENGSTPKIIAATATISHAKAQCNALYACGEDKVFQFPVQGLSYRDCFFAKEKSDAIGRKYIGLYGSAASSSATASIYTFATLIYAAKALNVKNESERDPYWTNLSYFGSMRELGQAATWFLADIKEHLEVIYHNRLQTRDFKNRRYIYENGKAELTSRMNNEEIPKILKNLEIKYPDEKEYPLDICLATNMVSVGVDIPRLGLMTVTGQPKSMSEYIQATSRVGRNENAPGIVLIIYNTSKPRDKSYYEKFQVQHSKLYSNVEPTSVTPFSRPLRERAIHAIFVALHRFSVPIDERDNPRRYPTKEEFEKYKDIIVNRALLIDKDEAEDIEKQLTQLWSEWQNWTPAKYSSFKVDETYPLMCMAGTIKPEPWENRGWDTPTSMRSVDRECGLDCNHNLVLDEEN